MKNKITRLFLCCASGLLLSACSGDSLSESGDVSLNATSTTTAKSQDITVADLVGTWHMYSMTSDVEVDFDQNGSYTYDLLEETTCFDFMYFIFDEQGSVATRQSRLYFSSTTGMFSCKTTGDYKAVYSVEGDQLTVTFTVNGTEYTETKTISRYNENGKEFLKVTLTNQETDSAVYVADDPGNTVASEIQLIEMIYLKQ